MALHDHLATCVAIAVLSCVSPSQASAQSFTVSGSGGYLWQFDTPPRVNTPISISPVDFSFAGQFGPEWIVEGPVTGTGSVHLLTGAFELARPPSVTTSINSFLAALNPALTLDLILAGSTSQHGAASRVTYGGPNVDQRVTLRGSASNAFIGLDQTFNYFANFGETFDAFADIVNPADPLALARIPFSLDDAMSWINGNSVLLSTFVSINRCPVGVGQCESFARGFSGFGTAVAAIPEVRTIMLMTLGLCMVAFAAHRRNQRQTVKPLRTS